MEVSGVDSTVVSKCLDLCQALVSQGQAFTLSLTHTGTSFTFSLDTRSKEKPSPMDRKLPSPSTRRRNARRREEFLKRNAEPSPEKPEASEGSWNSEIVNMGSTKSVMLKLKKKPSTQILQVDGNDEELTSDAETQTIKPKTKHSAVQTNKTVLDLKYSEEKNCISPPQQNAMGPYRAPKTNMGPYRARGERGRRGDERGGGEGEENRRPWYEQLYEN